MSARIPHDPVNANSRVCPDCDEPWPCVERKRQRENKKWIDRSLHDALYEPTSPSVEIDGIEALRWQSPVQWWVDLTYGERGLVVVVHSYDGDHRSDDATPEWLLSVAAVTFCVVSVGWRCADFYAGLWV